MSLLSPPFQKTYISNISPKSKSRPPSSSLGSANITLDDARAAADGTAGANAAAEPARSVMMAAENFMVTTVYFEGGELEGWRGGR